MLLSTDFLSVDEVAVVKSHRQRSSWDAHHPVQVVVHVEDLLLLSVQVSRLVGLALVDHGETHRAWDEDVVSVGLRRSDGGVDVVAVVGVYLGELS